jgi:hypothetical protein
LTKGDLPTFLLIFILISDAHSSYYKLRGLSGLQKNSFWLEKSRVRIPK